MNLRVVTEIYIYIESDLLWYTLYSETLQKIVLLLWVWLKEYLIVILIINHISKVMGVVLLFTRRSTLSSGFHIFPVMSMYFWCRLLHFCVMYISCVLLMDDVKILFWVHTWHMIFSTRMRWSYVGPTGYWGLDFEHVSCVMNVR